MVYKLNSLNTQGLSVCLSACLSICLFSSSLLSLSLTVPLRPSQSVSLCLWEKIVLCLWSIIPFLINFRFVSNSGQCLNSFLNSVKNSLSPCRTWICTASGGSRERDSRAEIWGKPHALRPTWDWQFHRSRWEPVTLKRYIWCAVAVLRIPLQGG